jgi:hypothetical protein
MRLDRITRFGEYASKNWLSSSGQKWQMRATTLGSLISETFLVVHLPKKTPLPILSPSVSCSHCWQHQIEQQLQRQIEGRRWRIKGWGQGWMSSFPHAPISTVVPYNSCVFSAQAGLGCRRGRGSPANGGSGFRLRRWVHRARFFYLDKAGHAGVRCPAAEPERYGACVE